MSFNSFGGEENDLTHWLMLVMAVILFLSRPGRGQHLQNTTRYEKWGTGNHSNTNTPNAQPLEQMEPHRMSPAKPRGQWHLLYLPLLISPVQLVWRFPLASVEGSQLTLDHDHNITDHELRTRRNTSYMCRDHTYSHWRTPNLCTLSNWILVWRLQLRPFPWPSNRFLLQPDWFFQP